MTAAETGWSRLLRRQFEFVDHRIGLVRLDNLEALARDVLPSRSYPIEWVIYRITGIDSTSEGDPTPVEGEALLAALVSLIEDMSRALGPLPFDADRDLSVEESARRLGVSARTIRRWRPRGLPILRFDGGDGRPRAGLRRDQLAWFAEIHRPRVDRARRRRPVDVEETEAIRRRFAERLAEGMTEPAAIRSMARESRRSVSTIRRLVGASPRTTAGGSDESTRRRRRRLVVRAHDRAIPIEAIAARLDRSPRSVHRLVLEVRRSRLQGLPVPVVVPAGVERQDAGRVFGAAGLLDLRCRREAGLALGAWLASVRADPDVDEEWTRQSIAAMHFALWRASRAAETILDGTRSTTVDRLDAIESDLRWWGLLRERSVRTGLTSGLRRVEQSLGRAIEGLPSQRIVELLDRLVVTTASVVDGFDPERRVLDHTLDRACGLAASRMMATIVPGAIAGAARARADLDLLPAPDLLRSMPESVRVLLRVERWWRTVGERGVSIAGFDVARVRHGFGDRDRPRTWRETGRILGRPASHLFAETAGFERTLRRQAIAGPS